MDTGLTVEKLRSARVLFDAEPVLEVWGLAPRAFDALVRTVAGVTRHVLTPLADLKRQRQHHRATQRRTTILRRAARRQARREHRALAKRGT